MWGPAEQGGVVGCLACDLSAGRRELPGGTIHAAAHWDVEHCTGPLGVGTLIVKPIRHVESVADLTPGEAAELGPLLARAAAVVDRLVEPEQVYVCLWSHTGRTRGHLHWVVEPATTSQIDGVGAGRYGPALQVAQFTDGTAPDPAAVEDFAASARPLFVAARGSGGAVSW